jgi:2-polyprenyl-6-methoxyphenol hydroxylase and related FAD-dependent oxidoreductases
MDAALPTRKQHAIVLGGSLTGLLTARVLSQYYAQVTIIEKDTVHREPEARKGQPQTRHLHGLLPKGLHIMSGYFAGLLDEITSYGAKVLDFGESMNWYCYGGFRKSFPINIKTVSISRPLLEHIIRERVLALSNVRLVDNTIAKHLTNDDKQKVTGVITEEKLSGRTESLSADLIIDSTGRGSRTPQWLIELGYGEIEVSEVKVNVGYTTRMYKRDPRDPRGEKWIAYTPQAPSETRFGGAFPIEGDRWMVTVGGWHGDHAPAENPGYLEFVKSLQNPDIYDIVSKNEPVSEFVQYKFPISIRRHYEKLRRFPVGFLVLGDAISSFNPIYAQGMSSASLQVEVLDKMLADNVADEELAKVFFKRSKKIIDTIWGLATGEDFRYPLTIGTRPTGIKLINKYVARMHRATTKDKVVCGAFLKVMALLESPKSLFHPKILWKVMRSD